ncbi:glycosyltransferase family 2 protein [Streptococcus massiliensis]|uniref:Glycosyl transferase family protein n=1 Tax=Streptococcus massiliensis TaxID=313439 RepID=A0A380KWU6_9STRE|nr:glycosyltransferase family 2 protein [Streptococcus massiliensis]SUN75739.1 glycosyl transferase family protein [Streptococcus massiliensis]
MQKKSDLLIIIPAYNEEASIEKVVNNLIYNYSQYDYVIINDGSKDKTSMICHRNNYNIIDLPVNLGLAGAFQTGLRFAYQKGYDKAVQFDADGQHLPEYISDLEKSINDGNELAIGSRFVTEKRPNSLRMLGNILISGAIKLTTGKTINDPTSGMRMFSKKLIKEFAQNINYGPEPDTVSYLLQNGVKVAEVQVKMEERQAGESYLTLSRSIKYMTHMFLSILIIQNFRKRG